MAEKIEAYKSREGTIFTNKNDALMHDIAILIKQEFHELNEGELTHRCCLAITHIIVKQKTEFINFINDYQYK